MLDSPCRTCRNHRAGCHANCPDYNSFVLRNEEEKRRIRQAKAAAHPMDGYIFDKRNARYYGAPSL